MTIPITFYDTPPSELLDLSSVMAVERERVRQAGLLTLALEALGRNDTKTVEACLARFDTPNMP